MKNKKGLVLTILFVFLLIGVSLPLFMINHKKVKAETVTDLTNTTWIFNDTLIRNSYIDAYVNFTSNNSNFNRLDGNLLWDDGEFYYGELNVYSRVWVNAAYKTIVITGGRDVTNYDLITWLQDNATLQTPIQTGTEIIHRYWAPDGVITMSDNQVLGDNDIQYTILFNQFTDTYTNTTQTGLIFKGVQTTQTPSWSYIESINGDGINLLYHGETNSIDNTMWLEFTTGDYMDTDLYNFMTTWGTWFDDANAYIVGINQGYVEGVETGRALGQADGVEYTNLVTRIFNGLGNILGISVFPGITIGLLIGLPLLLGVFIIIIKILRG